MLAMLWDVWMIPLSKDRVCHKQNLKDLGATARTLVFSSIRLLEPTDEDHSAIVICMNQHFRTWRRGGVNIIHPAGSMFVPGLLIQRLFFHRYSTIPATRPCQVAGPGDDSYKNMPQNYGNP